MSSWTFALPLAAGLLLGCQSGSSTGPSPAVSAKVDARPTLIWSDGARYAYTFSLTSGAEVTGQRTMEFTLSSQAMLDVRQAGPGDVEFAAVLNDAHFTAKDPENQPEFDALARELATPFTFKLHEGALAETRFPLETTAFAASIRRTLASLLQFPVQPSIVNGDVWTAKETDATGNYEAEYRRNPDGTVAKRKLRYEARAVSRNSLANFASIVPEVARSSGTWRFGSEPALGAEPAHLRLERVEASDTIVSKLTAAAAISADTSAKLAFVRQARPEPRFAWDNLLASTRVFAMGERIGPKVSPASYDKIRIGNYTFASALKELEKQGQDPRSNELFDKVRGEADKPEELGEREGRLKSQAQVFTAMAAILRAEPAHIPAVLSRIRAGSSAARPLIDALSSAGTLPAQRALIELMHDEKAPKGVRRTAAFALTRTSNASAETIDALAHEIDSELLRVYALYGLGTLGRHLAEAGEAARAAAITEILTTELGKADTPSRQVDALRGIANSGADSAFPAVRPFFESKVAKVHVAAIDAIRLMHRPEVDPILADALANGSEDLKLAALDAASVREPSAPLAKGLQSLADSTDRPGLRLKIVRVMGSWLKQRPEFKSPLLKFAQSDESEQVRLAAQNALGT